METAPSHTFENRECVGHPSGVLLLSFDEPRDEASGTRTAQEKFRLTMPSLLSRGTPLFIHSSKCLAVPPALVLSRNENGRT